VSVSLIRTCLLSETELTSAGDLIPRLRQSERALRQELLLSRATTSATEQELKSLIDRLQQQVHDLVRAGPSI